MIEILSSSANSLLPQVRYDTEDPTPQVPDTNRRRYHNTPITMATMATTAMTTPIAILPAGLIPEDFLESGLGLFFVGDDVVLGAADKLEPVTGGVVVVTGLGVADDVGPAVMSDD